ncbi:hypothetical protein [Zooshikella ganghwensis]|uniref:hypothetical protein n=1 Tax=Zooshikella ganghwensis TaxID=202772 RepID=UPI000407AE95|nr:hypothetical protein [Zooshikella ganghwensis]
MKKALLLIVITSFFSGCAVPVKRSLQGHTLVSEGFPKISLNIPTEYELVDSYSGKRNSDTSKSSSERESWYYFYKRNSKRLVETTLDIRFYDGDSSVHYSDDTNDARKFNFSYSVINGIRYTTYFMASKMSDHEAKFSVAQCRVDKFFVSTFPPQTNHMFVISYTAIVPCNKVENNRVVDKGLINEIDKSAYKLLLSLSKGF